MYLQPAGPRIADESTYGAGTSSSNVNRPENNNYSHLNNVGSIHSPNYHYHLPPPPSYFGPHLIDSARPTEPKFLSNWCVTVKSIQELGDSSLIAALSGTLLENDCQTISCENFEAGRLVFVISKNIVKTNEGIYHLLGPIAQGYPSNLYHACLEAGGVPRTWKYILTQFSGRPSDGNQIMTSRAAHAAQLQALSDKIQELIRSFKILRHMAIIAEKRLKEHANARKSISFVRHLFKQKLHYSLKVVNNDIILGIKEVLKK